MICTLNGGHFWVSHAPRNVEELHSLCERDEKMRAIEQRGNSPSHERGRKGDTKVVIRAQERNAGAMGHSPIAGWCNPSNGVAARHSVPSRFSPKKTGNGRGLRAHWRENLCLLVAIASSLLCELSVRCLPSGILSSFLIRWTILCEYQSSVTFLLLRVVYIVGRIFDSDFFIHKESFPRRNCDGY